MVVSASGAGKAEGNERGGGPFLHGRHYRMRVPGGLRYLPRKRRRPVHRSEFILDPTDYVRRLEPLINIRGDLYGMLV